MQLTASFVGKSNPIVTVSYGSISTVNFFFLTLPGECVCVQGSECPGGELSYWWTPLMSTLLAVSLVGVGSPEPGSLNVSAPFWVWGLQGGWEPRRDPQELTWAVG